MRRSNISAVSVVSAASLVCAVTALSSVTACASANTRSDLAQTLYQRGRHREAERAADHQLQRDPENPDLWRIKINAAIRGGDSARGVDLYMQWHKLRHRYDETALRAMAVSTLWHALRDAAPEVRAQAIGAIEHLRVRELRPELSALLDDPSDIVAAAAVVALATGHADDAISDRALVHGRRLLTNADPRVRAHLIAGLGRARRSRFKADILSLLSSDPDAGVRRAAATALGRHATSEDRTRLLRVAAEDPDGAVRAAALRALARKPGDKVSDKVSGAARAALEDDYVGARLAGLAIIAQRPEDNRDLLDELARSSDLSVALRASLAVRKAGGQVPVQTLQLALAHSRWTVRVAALNAVAELLIARQALAMIDERVTDERIEVRLAAARVLMRLGERARARAILAAALQAPRDEPRLEAAIDLMRMNDELGRQALTRLGQSPRPATRRQVVEAYRFTDNPSLPLVKAMGDVAAEVRVSAASTLLGLARAP